MNVYNNRGRSVQPVQIKQHEIYTDGATGNQSETTTHASILHLSFATVSEASLAENKKISAYFTHVRDTLDLSTHTWMPGQY